MYRIAFIISLVIISAHTALGLSGSGTEAEPWRIESLADFNEFAADANYWDDYTRLETDVNLAGLIYTTAVIAPDFNNSNDRFDGTAFTGSFDGNDKRIINLTIDDAGAGNDYLGLFGYIGEGGEVKNLGLEGGSVSGDWGVGGLAGGNDGNVSNCYSTGDVNGSLGVGGLVGVSYWDFGGGIWNCYSTSSVRGSLYVGGLVGFNGGSVSYCYSTGPVSGDDYVGGLVGGNDRLYEDYGSGVSNCYSTGDVNGISCVGGLVGVNGLYHCSPILGYIYNSYSTGVVEGVSSVGGLVGANVAWEYIEGSFWDIETSGQIESDGGTGKTTVEMQTKSTFAEAGWDFQEIWDIGEKQTYPYLRQYLSADMNHDGRVNMLDFAILAGHWLEGASGISPPPPPPPLPPPP